MYLGVSVFAAGSLTPVKSGGPLAPFPGRAPTDPLSGSIMKNSVRVLKTSRGFRNGKGLILGKTNYLGELFKNYLRGALGHFLK